MARVGAAAFILAIAVGGCSRAASVSYQRDLSHARETMWRGDLAEARAEVEEGAKRASAAGDTTRAWQFRLLGGEVAVLRRDFAAAQQIVDAALPSDAQDPALRSRQKFLEGKLCVAKNRLEAARAALAEARQLAPAGSDLSLDIDHLDGQVLMRLGRWDEADATLNRVVARAADSSDQYHQAIALNDLGMGRVVRSRYDEALPYFERVGTLRSLSDFSIYAASLSNAGSCYQRLGQFDRALAMQERAFQVHERRGKPEYFVQALGEIGNLHVLRGAPKEALPFLKRAYDAATSARLQAEAALWAGNLASAETMLGEWDEAERYNESARQLKTSLGSRRLVYNTLVAASIAAGRGRFDEAARGYEAALKDPDVNADVRWTAHAGLADVAMKAGRSDDAGRHFEAALDVIEKTRSDLLKTDYKLSYLTQLITFYRNYVDALLQQGKVERALEVADSSRGQVLAERQRIAAPPRVDAAQLRRLAGRSGATFLSYWLTPGRSVLWIVSADGVRTLPLPSSDAIATLVREHQQAIANVLASPLAGTATAGDRLYQMLVAPAVPALKPDSSIVIVPDGALHGLNFETLPVDGARRHFWIEDVQIEVAPSLASLTAPPPPAPKGSGAALVVGDPLPRDPEYPSLKFAPVEMAAIGRHFGADRTTAIARERATPAAYREAHPDRFSYVHFAAHATANVESPLDSAVILSGADAGYKLYARDVAALPLHADLVTVSACRSAGERAYSGEGLVGFAWAFLRAGARRVVAGLWDVEDRSTAELMDQLYAGIAAGKTPAAALREAKLTFLRQGGRYALPYAWGAFELFTTVP